MEEVSGKAPEVHSCCTCSTFGCRRAREQFVSTDCFADCTACKGTCTAAFEAEYGSCALVHTRVRDLRMLEVLVPVPRVPGSLGYGMASAFVDVGRWVYATDNRKPGGGVTVGCWSTDDPTPTIEGSAVLVPPSIPAEATRGVTMRATTNIGNRARAQLVGVLHTAEKPPRASESTAHHQLAVCHVIYAPPADSHL